MALYFFSILQYIEGSILTFRLYIVYLSFQSTSLQSYLPDWLWYNSM